MYFINSNYLSGSCRAFAKYCNSFFKRKPLALWSNPSPIIELCALWAVPILRNIYNIITSKLNNIKFKSIIY